MINDNSVTTKKIENLKNKLEGKKKEHYEKLVSKMVDYSKTEKLYYDYRTLLGFSFPDQISDEEYSFMDSQMPILEQKIKVLRGEVKVMMDEMLLIDNI